ncbi:NAD(+)/NADH kinase [Aureliella helgolandensis]|uniref:NAD kinase n=1 Tax=Aureliella helgolandensis TaxID=2527968 RepID=A0A518GF58_9BACT|nr:NAD(+)/NADH kinase [Aureliella helgolandensis]QDV27190.1 putative inorganic polyphosphate/ATP-NAD kinase [Aureliella helgolandensis]
MTTQYPWNSAAGAKPRVVVLASVNRARVRTELGRIERILAKSADIVAIDEDESFDFQKEKADLAVVLGGDGSILSAARRMCLQQIPVIGVNLGRLGFLAALGENELEAIWPEVCMGCYPIDEHAMLQCTIVRGWGASSESGVSESGYQLALNEASIMGGPPFSMLQIDLYVDDELASTYSCDGLIISTPVGSTAHNLSAGGPILHRRLEAVVISPISPHTLTMRPVVDRADRKFEMVIRQGHESVAAVFDGRVLGPLREGDCYRITRAPVSFQMISVPGKGEYKTLRDKLGWGGNPRVNKR